MDVKPFRARVGAVSPVLFKGGEGCGACYKVKCLDKEICSRRAVTVIITDECPGGYCSGGHIHFDLSGAAFSRMAIGGEGAGLRDRGMIPVIFRRYYLILFVLHSSISFFTFPALRPFCFVSLYVLVYS